MSISSGILDVANLEWSKPLSGWSIAANALPAGANLHPILSMPE